MRTTTFESAKVGDRCYGPMFGPCDEKRQNATIGFNSSLNQLICISVVGDNGQQISFDRTGKSTEVGDQELFWSKPIFIAPEQPKRKVTNTVERWVNLTFLGTHVVSLCYHDSQSDADTCENVLRRTACVHLTGTYETEE